MSRATPEMREFAKRLIAYETLGSKASETSAIRAFRVGDKLRPHLSTLMGNAGFKALLSRALTLANAEVPWLRGVQVGADGSLEGFERPQTQLDPSDFLEGKVVLLARLLGLLEAFIGPSLTLRLVREVWPKAPLNDLDFGKGGEHDEEE